LANVNYLPSPGWLTPLGPFLSGKAKMVTAPSSKNQALFMISQIFTPRKGAWEKCEPPRGRTSRRVYFIFVGKNTLSEGAHSCPPRRVIPALSRNPEIAGTGFPLPDQVEDKFRGNDKAHRRNSRTTKIARLAAKAEKTPNDDR
jgi:hypothetical protein